MLGPHRRDAPAADRGRARTPFVGRHAERAAPARACGTRWPTARRGCARAHGHDLGARPASASRGSPSGWRPTRVSRRQHGAHCVLRVRTARRAVSSRSSGCSSARFDLPSRRRRRRPLDEAGDSVCRRSASTARDTCRSSSTCSASRADRFALPRARSAPAPRAHVRRARRVVVHARAPSAPTLLLVEDLQWADQTTLEWLTRSRRSTPTLPFLLARRPARPEFRAAAGPDRRAARSTSDGSRPPITWSSSQELAGVHAIPEDLWPAHRRPQRRQPAVHRGAARSRSRSTESDGVAARGRDPPHDPRSPHRPPRRARQRQGARAVGGRHRARRSTSTCCAPSPGDRASSWRPASRTSADAGILEEITGAAPPVTHRFVHALVRDAAYESQEQGQRLEVHSARRARRLSAGRRRPGLVAQHFDAGRVPDQR